MAHDTWLSQYVPGQGVARAPLAKPPLLWEKTRQLKINSYNSLRCRLLPLNVAWTSSTVSWLVSSTTVFFTKEFEDTAQLRDEVRLEPRVVDQKEFAGEAGDVATVHPLPPTTVLGHKLQPRGILGVRLAQMTVQNWLWRTDSTELTVEKWRYRNDSTELTVLVWLYTNVCIALAVQKILYRTYWT